MFPCVILVKWKTGGCNPDTDLIIWRCPKMVVPLNPPFIDWFSIINYKQSILGYPHCYHPYANLSPTASLQPGINGPWPVALRDQQSGGMTTPKPRNGQVECPPTCDGTPWTAGVAWKLSPITKYWMVRSQSIPTKYYDLIYWYKKN